MASWTTPVIHSTGDVFAVTDWNGLANDVTFLYQAPAGSAYDSGGTSIANATWTQISLAGLTFNNGYQSLAISANAWEVGIAGIYQVSAAVSLNYTSTSGITWAAIGQNGTIIKYGPQITNIALKAGSTLSGIVKCAANDLIQLYAYQSTGGTQGAQAGAAFTFLDIAYIGSI